MAPRFWKVSVPPRDPPRPLANASHPAPPAANGHLALALQEVFTATVRLRGGRQVGADAGSFRAHIKTLLAAADSEARRHGYDGGDVRLAIYAIVAFLDESVLQSDQTMFADWPRQPLQEEVFGDHMAGETFFQHVRSLMGRQDSAELADLLEVFDLCLLLGFRGRYGAETAELRSLRSAIREKIERIRGAAVLAPSAPLPDGEVIPDRRDPWARRLTIAAVAALVLCVLLYGGFRFALGGQVGELREIAAGAPALEVSS